MQIYFGAMICSHSSVSGKLISHTRGSLSGGRWRCLCRQVLLRCVLRSLWTPSSSTIPLHRMCCTKVKNIHEALYLLTITAWFCIQLISVCFFPFTSSYILIIRTFCSRRLWLTVKYVYNKCYMLLLSCMFLLANPLFIRLFQICFFLTICSQ